MTTPCRKCEVCSESSHHWLWAADEEFPCGYYTCKHCDATGMECMECDGTGGDDNDPCVQCCGEGVVQVQLIRNEPDQDKEGE
jgi:hypothetical protein